MASGNKQSGSGAMVAIVAVAALSMTFLLVQRFSRGSMHAVDAAKVDRLRTETNIAAVNAMSRYKALLSPSKRAPGVYIPALYAKDYYADRWTLVPEGQIGGIASRKGSRITFENRQQVLKEADISKLMSTGSMDLPPENVSVRMLKTIKDKSGRVTTAMDVVAITRESNGKMQKFSVPSRLSLAVPVPFDAKIAYRKAGGKYSVMKDGDKLDNGPYEFAVITSGVAYDADIIFNGKVLQTFGGFDDNGKITHKAVSYAAKEKVVGPWYDYNPTVPAPTPPPSSSDGTATSGNDKYVSSDGTSCGYDPANPINATHNGGTSGTTAPAVPTPPPAPVMADFSVVVRGPDASETATAGPFKVQVSPDIPPVPAGGQGNEEITTGGIVTLDDYKTKCTKECPYLGDDPTGGELGGYAAFSKTQQDVSGKHTFLEAQNRWKIKDKKVCFNFQNNNKNNGKYDFHDSDIVAYDIKTCKKTFLFRRGACGCLTGDTLITLGDGVSQKRIDQLTEDDLVYNPIKKRAYPLRKMTRGPEEKPLVRLVYGEQVLNATSNHPFLSEAGVIAASKLKAGDRIALPDGRWQVLDDVLEIAPEGELPIVWNLEIEAPNDDKDAHFVIANGVSTGDLVIQSDLEKKP